MEILRERFFPYGKKDQRLNSCQPVRKWNKVKEGRKEISLSWPPLTREFWILKTPIHKWLMN